MTDKDIRKLKRQELLEILYYMRTELDDVREENDRLKQRLETRDKDYEHIMESMEQITEKLDALGGKRISVPQSGKTLPAKPKNRRGKSGR